MAVIALEPLDLTALEPAAQAMCVETMGRLLCSVEVPVQFVVRRRRVTSPAPPDLVGAHLPADALDHAVRAHHAHLLSALPAFRSDVVAVMRHDGHAAGLRRQVAMAAEMLHSAGVRSREVAAGEVLCGAGVEALRSVLVDGGVRCGLELERLPGRSVGLGWLHTMLAAPAEFDAAIHLVPVDAAAAHRAVERRLRNLTADRLLDLDRGRIGDAGVDVGLEAAGTLRDRLARNEVRALRLSIVVAVRGADEAEARHGADVVRAAAAGAGLRLRHTHMRHAMALRATLPLGEVASTGKLIDSAAGATCLPLTETVCDDAAGYRLGVTRRTGVPLAVDVFDTAQHSNANLAVFATSGHGKSYTIGALVLEATARGVGALIVDPEGEYQRLMHAAGGQYLRLGSAGAGALNVFDVAPTPREAIPVAVDLVNVLCGSALDEVERAEVDAAMHDAVDAAARAGRAALLGDCAAALAHTAPRAATVLRRVCNGPLASIFNRASDIDLEGDLCAISLRELPHEFVPAATLLIAQWLWTRVRSERKRRHIVLDEVGALCVHPPLRELLVQLARRCRKYSASLVVATQNVEDLLRSEEGAVVATNCATVLLGGHRAAEAMQMERAFGLTEAQRRFVEHASRGEFLLLAGRRRCEIRVDMPELHRSILVAESA
ncbi:MAG: ATP-binding protein [Candidatus Dormibacteraeota bacterium]|nr:ATP-binding protein [Candidatus Dormibacteraeota bacterium]